MGQQSDSGRNASLDDKKVRAAGRQKEMRVKHTDATDDTTIPKLGRGRAGGAFGTSKPARARNLSKGGGGGGGRPSTPKD